ncbi:MAG: hypothetical protein OXD43_07565 [Bacteroidetes bacterium]|nr:hypothetical protein [Bacteroidota bacterium]
MSSLTDIEKRYFEKLFGMSSGYVLDFSNATFDKFFRRYNVNIHGPKYQTFGTSKAKKLRAFWESEPDQLVGPVLSEMLASYEADCELTGQDVDKIPLERARRIVDRLTGVSMARDSAGKESEFLDREFAIPSIQKLPIDPRVVPIVEARLNEARIALGAGAHLSVIFLCGSVLEAVLLGAARQSPAIFNQAKATPTKNCSPKRFHEWSLAQLINVAYEVGILKLDIKKFSHGLRDFRNYIHPYEQLASGFTPDEHTAKVCFQVLKAALASLAGER